MNFEPYAVYVQIDSNDRITAVNSSAFLPDTTGWVEIDRGYDDRFHHAQGNYFPEPVVDERGICRYKLVDGKPVERTQEEMDADWVEPVPEPSLEEQIAQLEDELKAAKILLGLEV